MRVRMTSLTMDTIPSDLTPTHHQPVHILNHPIPYAYTGMFNAIYVHTHVVRHIPSHTHTW